MKAQNQLLKPVKYGFLAGGTLFNSNKKYIKSFQECATFLEEKIVFGTGVRSPEFWSNVANWSSNLDEWKPLLEECCFIGVRGPLSAEILKEHKIKNVEVVGDPVLVFADNTFPPPRSRKKIGLNVGVSEKNVWGGEAQIIREFCSLAKFLKEKNLEVSWFVVHPGDLEVTRFCAKHSGANQHVFCYYNDYEGYLDAVKDLTVFVGMKLHSVVLAVCKYVPSIMIEYRPKCLDFMRSIQQDDLSFRSDRFRAGPVLEIISDLSRRHDERVRHLFKSIGTVKERQLKKAREIQRKILG